MIKRTTLLFIAAVCLLAGCTGTDNSGESLRSVCLTRPEAMSEESVKHYSGVVKAAHEIGLGFKTAGQISRIHVREGDRVRKGELLAELDDADYRLAVEALQIQYDQLKDEVDRTARLFNQKSVSANDYEKAVAGLHQLGIQLQANQNKLDYTKLYAPTDGYVRKVGFSPAEMVDAGTSVITLLDMSGMEVSVDIPVEEYLNREHFVRYYCRLAESGISYPMSLSSISPSADGNQLYRLELTFVSRPDDRLTAGMNVEVGIVASDTASLHGFTLPLRSVFRDGDTSCVWVLKSDSTVAKRPVRLAGTDSRGRAVIVEGLTGEEQIVRAGVNVLLEGEHVKVIGQPSKTNVGGVL